jgi:hypothetical protein
MNLFSSKSVKSQQEIEFDSALDNEAAMKPEAFELPDVNHSGIQTPLAPVVHPKMNSGKEFPLTRIQKPEVRRQN